jgi:hypothetical protein
VFFVIVSSCYLYRNDFSNRTLDVIFPVAGAILLSLYLGVKNIWIDAPEPNTHRTTIVLVNDEKLGTIHSLAIPSDVSPAELSLRFLGLKRIMKYKTLDSFKDLHEWEALRSESEACLEEFIAHLLEFAILDWLSINGEVGEYEIERVVLPSGSLQTFGFDKGNPLVPVSVKIANAEINPFIRAQDITLKLPTGSEITRERRPDARCFNFRINTPKSEIEFRCTGITTGGFSTRSSSLNSNMDTAQKIADILRFPKDSFGLNSLSMSVEIITKVKPFTRHSNQAEIESKWQKSIVERFEADFSWEKLRRSYISL